MTKEKIAIVNSAASGTQSILSNEKAHLPDIKLMSFADPISDTPHFCGSLKDTNIGPEVMSVGDDLSGVIFLLTQPKFYVLNWIIVIIIITILLFIAKHHLAHGQ